MSEPEEAQPGLEPWRREQAVALVVGLTVSGLAVIAGYTGTSGEARLTDQYPWLTLAIVGVAGAGLAHARWLLSGMTALRLRQRQVLPAVEALSKTPALGGMSEVSMTSTLDREWVAVVGTSGRYHRPGCALVAGKVTESARAAEFAAEGRASCGICVQS